MKQSFTIGAAFGTVLRLSLAQDVSWCKSEGCNDCPSSLTSNGPGYPECVIYDSRTVFGGQGFLDGTGKVKYRVWGKMADPCGGQPGSIMIRSPSTLTTEGCGDLIWHSENAECTSQLRIEDTFMVQFCCGSGDCNSAGVPWGRRDESENVETLSLGGGSGGGGFQAAHLQFANGTIIEPIAVGSPPEAGSATKHRQRRQKNQCDSFKEDSYIADGSTYLKTFDTQIVSSSVPAEEEDRTITITYDQSVSRSSSFQAGIAYGIISASVGFEFSDSESKGFQAQVSVFAGESGRVGFAPVYQCSKGTLETCDSKRTDSGETCTPWVQNGIVQGDYRIVQT